MGRDLDCGRRAFLTLFLAGASLLLPTRLLLWSSRAAQVDVSIAIDGTVVQVSSRSAGRDTNAGKRACKSVRGNKAAAIACEEAVRGRIENVRRVQTERLVGVGAWRLALGVVSYARIETASGSFPIFVRPVDGPKAALHEWSLVYGRFIDESHLVDLSADEPAILRSLQLLNSATVEVFWVILPAVCLGLACGLVLKLSSESIDAKPFDRLDCFFLQHKSGFERIKFGLAISVVLGHSFDLTDSTTDMCSQLFGVPLSTLACACMFFLSGISSASALRQRKQTHRRVFADFLLPRVRRLWGYSFLTIVGISVLRTQLPTTALMLQICVGNFIEWNAAPPTFIHNMRFANTDILPVAASLWTVGLSVQCWTLSAAMHSASLLSTVPLICVLTSLLATGCNTHVSSFFFGCLLVAVARDYHITENTLRTRVLHPSVVCATIPWGSFILGQTWRVKTFLIPLFMILLRTGATFTPSLPSPLFIRYIKGTVVGLFCFSSAIQRWAIDTFPDHFSSSPWLVFVLAVFVSMCVARGLSFWCTWL